MQMLAADLIATTAVSILRPLLLVFSDKLALDFLFGGEVMRAHLTKFALDKFVERYEESVTSLNRAVTFSVAFIPIALLPYTNTVNIPLIDVDVSLQYWARLCPAISYGLQLYTLVTLCWFLLLRRGLVILKDHTADTQEFGEIANILLTGPVGGVWMLLSVRRHLPSRWHLIWFIPLAAVLFVVLLSPAGLCVYFVLNLFQVGDLAPAIIYTLMLVPSVALGIVLAAVGVLAGVREIMP